MFLDISYIVIFPVELKISRKKLNELRFWVFVLTQPREYPLQLVDRVVFYLDKLSYIATKKSYYMHYC